MPTIIKPRTLGIMTRTERQGSGASLIVSAYGMFHLATPDPCRFEDEQGLWLMVGKELPLGAVFDSGMPKPVAEVLVGGYAAAPGGTPVPRMGLSWEVAGLRKRLLVTGDRVWRIAKASAEATEPTPFVQMPLTPARCFGGEGFAENPGGTGFRARERLLAHEAVALPNLEIPEQAVRSFTDTPDSATFGPLAFDAKERLRHAGTYDAAWLKTRAPGLPLDVDPRLFLFAPAEQRLPGHLQGGEGYRLRGFSADHPAIEGRLPDFRVRCFVGWTDPAKPVAEVRMRIDTLWLFAGAERGILIHRGALPVEDFEAADVADVMLAYELHDADLPTAHYLRVRELRTDRKQAFKYALADHQLSPARPQAQLDARTAARRDRDAARRAKQEEDFAWVERKFLAEAKMPPELMPAPAKLPPEDHPLPLPLPEEVATGEIDLAALLDAMEATQRRMEAEAEEAQAKYEPMTRAMDAFKASDEGPGAVDKLFEALGQGDVVAQLDAGFARLPDTGELKPTSDKQAEAFAALDRAKDWRGSIWEAMHPKVDEAAQLALARARFLGLPEGSPLAGFADAFDGATLTIPEIDLSTLEGRPSEPSAGERSLAQTLAQLESTSGLAPDRLATVKDSLARADAQIRSSFPTLKAKPGEALDALKAASARGGETRDPPPGSAAAVADARARTAELPGRLREEMAKEAESATETFTTVRRLSLAPMRPEEPFTPHVARALGEMILAEAHGGLSLAGRDLAGADLSGADLSGQDLSKALLENVRLDGANLRGARLGEATLCGASLVGADLSGCDLTKANLAKADATRARLDGAILMETSVHEASFTDARFDGAKLSKISAMGIPFDGASFRRAQATSCIFVRCDFARTRWTGASLARVQFIDGDCTTIAFDGAHLMEVAFVKAQAAGADFSDAKLDSVSFAGEVDLRGALFPRVVGKRFSVQGTDLSGATFERARLDAACFVNAVLAKANFKATSLKRAILSRNDCGGTEFSFANLWEAQLNRADLRGACLASANLYGADLSDARLTGADLDRANLGRTVLELAHYG